ncbi:MAG: thiolase family protein [Chloroflexota bacterium]|nr:thiolase family protein [Chloroflexota bacterium]
MESVVIVAAKRTAIGAFGKAFKDVPIATIGATPLRAAMAEIGIAPGDVDDVIIGCVGQIGQDAYIARAVALGAGLPIEVPAYTVNRLCGSGAQAIGSATQAILAGDARIVVAGGVEKMSGYPLLADVRWGTRLGDTALKDSLTQALSDPFSCRHMGTTAENIARRDGVSRADQDAFSVLSQQRTASAVEAGGFDEQIIPVTAPGPKRTTIEVTRDEHPRPDTTVETLGRLPAVFEKDGSVTAGNAAGINDAGSATVMMAASEAQARGITPLARVVGWAVVGVEPEYMGIGPVPAVRKVLAKTDLTLDDIALFELNEAFAAQSLACIRELGLDMDKVNVNGGAIALGHPIGATGNILAVKLIHELRRRGERYGIVTACIGGGQGIAVVFENPAA